MALNGTTLGTIIKNAIKAWNPNPMTPSQETVLEEGWQTIANEITNHIQTFLDAVEVNYDGSSSGIPETDVQNAIDRSLGLVPIGVILAWHKNLTGTPALPDNFVECNGQVLSDSESPYDGETMPDLNGDARFVRGGAISGVIQDHQLEDHTHSHTPAFGIGSTGSNFGMNNNVLVGQYFAVGNPDSGNHGAETRPKNMSVVFIIRIK